MLSGQVNQNYLMKTVITSAAGKECHPFNYPPPAGILTFIIYRLNRNT